MGEYDSIPLNIDSIPPKNVDSAIPLRLRDAKKRAEVRNMDCGVHGEVPLDESGCISDNGGKSSLSIFIYCQIEPPPPLYGRRCTWYLLVRGLSIGLHNHFQVQMDAIHGKHFQAQPTPLVSSTVRFNNPGRQQYLTGKIVT